MSEPMTIFKLFGVESLEEFVNIWPFQLIQETTGIPIPGSDLPRQWLERMNLLVEFRNLRTGFGGGRASVEAELRLKDDSPPISNGLPFVLTSMIDVQFFIKPFDPLDKTKFAQFFATVSDRGTEVILEGLPVEIRLPAGLLAQHPALGREKPAPKPGQEPDDEPEPPTQSGSFTAGNLSSLQVNYETTDKESSILVHIRLRMTEDGEFTIRPCVPISFGKCMLSGIPCRAVHGFNLVPSPSLALKEDSWIRHDVTPWHEQMIMPNDGLFVVRSLHIDGKEEPFDDIHNWVTSHSANTGDAEFVLDDLVMPFFSPYIIPIPRHVTIGFRHRKLVRQPKRLATSSTLDRAASFETSPIKTSVVAEPQAGFILNSFFYESLPLEDCPDDVMLPDIGFRFSLLAFWDTESGQRKLDISLAENYTFRVAYLRDVVNAPIGAAAPPGTIEAVIDKKTEFGIIYLKAVRVGLSIGRLVNEDASFKDSAEITVDLLITPPLLNTKIGDFEIQSIDGSPIQILVEGVGWRQGHRSLDGIKVPEGIALVLPPVKILIQEIAVLSEHGASYLSFSGGLGLKIPGSLEGGIVFKRLRFRLSGNENAPSPKLDGFFGKFKTPSGSLDIEVGGFFISKTEPGKRGWEAALTGTVIFKPVPEDKKGLTYRFSLDFLLGKVEDLINPNDSFAYLLIQLFVAGSFPLGTFELRSIRLLGADGLTPKLPALNRDSYELRYYNWNKSVNPLLVPGDRRLSASIWKQQKNTLTVGVGLSGSWPGLNKIGELSVFVLVLNGEDEKGFMVALELLALTSKKAIAFFVVELDIKNCHRWTVLGGVDLQIKDFIKNPPEWLNKINVKGTCFATCSPQTVALGRLFDQRTWLTATFDANIWVERIVISVGLCLELREGDRVLRGLGLFARIEGEIKAPAKVLRIIFSAGMALFIKYVETGSKDHSTLIEIFAAIRAVLFSFLRFGLSVHADLRDIGLSPFSGHFILKLRFETPWYLPDITWTCEWTKGQMQMAALEMIITPLRTAAVLESLKRNPVHAERFFKEDASGKEWSGEGVIETFSISEARKGAAPEEIRLQRFKANTAVQPIATDSTIAVEFSVIVKDKLGLKVATSELTGLPETRGEQQSGDLKLSYELIGISVRRRARFVGDAPWLKLQELAELREDFSGPEGVIISGSFIPQGLKIFWDLDTRSGSEIATKKLLFNALPIEFITANPEVDEETVRMQQDWPCCKPRTEDEIRLLQHEVIFRSARLGEDLDAPRLFTDSKSRLMFLRTAYVRPQQFGSAIPSDSRVAFAKTNIPGPVFRAELDEDAAFCFLRLAWKQNPQFKLMLLAFDGLGDTVASRSFDLTNDSDFQEIRIAGSGPIRRLEASLVLIPPDQGSTQTVCTEFSTLPEEPGPNPRTHEGATYLVQDSTGRALPESEIRTIRNFTGLDCERRMEIRLPFPCDSVELNLVHFGEQTHLAAFNADFTKGDTAKMSSFQNQAERIRLTAEGITLVVVRDVDNDTLLLDFCFEAPSALVPVHIPPSALEVDRVAYIGLRDYLDGLRESKVCQTQSSDFKQKYEGKGKLFFLPNHDYEIELTTRVTVSHPSKTNGESAEIKEYVYFSTKGLPGLNAVNRVGQEIEPYVSAIYSGGKGILYREEPVTLAFNEKLIIGLPIEARPPGLSEERRTPFRLTLVARPEIAGAAHTPFTATDEDWIVTHRTVDFQEDFPIWESIPTEASAITSNAISSDLLLARLATLTQRAGTNCDLADPRRIRESVLIAPPQGVADSEDPDKEFWLGSTRYTATVKMEGAGFVDRRSFELADLNAFTFSRDKTAGDNAAWSITDGKLRAAADGLRHFAIFGEPSWDHLVIETTLNLNGQTGLAGVGLSLPAGNIPSRGLFAVIEIQGNQKRLAIYLREQGTPPEDAGTQFRQVAVKDIPDQSSSVSLLVTAFDDKLRASVGETAIEVERGELRQGRVSLLAQGEADFTSVQVSGLNMFAFPFSVSRYHSFQEHIGSFSGKVDAIDQDALGLPPQSETTSQLWQNEKEEIENAMLPESNSLARQTIFDRWVNKLRLPLKDEISKLQLSGLVVGSKIELLLLESPEPLDFTEEIKLTMFKLQLTGPSTDPDSSQVGGGSEDGLDKMRDPIDTRLLQDGTGSRAIIIPVSGASTTELQSGTYEIVFNLNRQRWDTTDLPNDENRYERESAIVINI